jgi:hypothetical protein
MGARRIATIALSGALLAGGTGAAIAAVTKDEGAKAEQAVLDSAAKKLNVTPEKLRDALAAAQDEQLDAAVKAGKLTQKQADEIKAARKQSGHVLGVGPGLKLRGGPGMHMRGFAGPLGPGGPGGPGGFGVGPFEGLAKALGISEDKLHEQLRDGKSLADIAKAAGTSLTDVKASLKAATKAKLDKAVKDEDLTQKQADAILEEFDEHFDAFASGRKLRFHREFRGGGKPPLGVPRPGAFVPGEPGAQSVPAVPAPPDGVII